MIDRVRRVWLATVLGALCVLAACGDEPPAESWEVDTLAAYLLEPERFRAEDPRVRRLQSYFPEVTMPPFDYPESERRALATWLLRAPQGDGEGRRAERLYHEWGCELCHGAEREGTELGPSLVEIREGR